jgi:hypothetical protein
MTEMVTYEGDTGLIAVVKALEGVRYLLYAGKIEPKQAAGYLGCLNLHLAQTIGVGEDLMHRVEECGGLLCPSCKAFVGFVSDLSGRCYHCGERIFPPIGE